MTPSAANQANQLPPRRARRSHRRFLPWLGALLALVGGYVAYAQFLRPEPPPAAAPQLAEVTRGSVVATVSATGSVVPAATADLSFKSSGRLVELAASVGQSVAKGDLLARQDDADPRLQLLQAQAQLAGAEAKLESLLAGAGEAEIAQARAQLAGARTKLSQLRTGPTPTEVKAAEAAVASARGQSEKARADLESLRAGPSEQEIVSAQVAVERARIALHEAQAAYDRIAWRADAGASKEAMALWQATVDHQAAEVAYQNKKAGPTAVELAQAEAAVANAESQLAAAEEKLATSLTGATADDLAAAEAAVLQAESQLELKLNPNNAADVQAARASVEQAKAAVRTAQNNLDAATIVAPFDGVVAAVNGAVGETVSGAVVTLLDMSAPELQISLAEMDVAKIEVGQQAVLTFEALGGQQVAGRVSTVAPRASVQSGVATYTATIRLQAGGPRAAGGTENPGGPTSPTAPSGTVPQAPEGMRQRLGQGATGTAPQWPAGPREQPEPGATAATRPAAVDLSRIKPGMTAGATIVYLRIDDVLVVPNRAIRAQGQSRVVDVIADGQVETRVVTVGASDAQRTEILDGLREGEQVVLPSSATSTTSATMPGAPGMTPGSRGTGGLFIPR